MNFRKLSFLGRTGFYCSKWFGIGLNYVTNFNPIQSSVGFHVETSHLFYSIKQMTSCYMKRKLGWNELMDTSQCKTYPANTYLFKSSDRNSWKRCEKCSKLTIKTPERHHWHRSDAIIANFEHVSPWCFQRDKKGTLGGNPPKYLLLEFSLSRKVT